MDLASGLMIGGLQKVQVAEAFDQVADTYDLMVGLNPGYHDHLRLAADSLLDRVVTDRPVLLDLGCGSGLSTAALSAAATARGMLPEIIGVDASAGMLAQARSRQWPDGVRFLHARAEDLADADLPPADGILACYLLRNVTDLPGTVTAMHAAVRKGSPVVIQEYSVAGSVSAQRRWVAVNRLIIRPLSRLVARRPELYDYLHASVDDFVSVDQLASVLIAGGFEGLQHRTVRGWQRDILHLFRAQT